MANTSSPSFKERVVAYGIKDIDNDAEIIVERRGADFLRRALKSILPTTINCGIEGVWSFNIWKFAKAKLLTKSLLSLSCTLIAIIIIII